MESSKQKVKPLPFWSRHKSGTLEWGLPWAPAHQSMAQVLTHFLETMAYLSVTGVIGVKFVGLFLHRPETRHLMLQATDMDTRCGSLTSNLILI